VTCIQVLASKLSTNAKLQNLQDLNLRTFQGFSSTFKHLICFQALSRALKFLFQIQAFSRISQAHYEPCVENASSQASIHSHPDAHIRTEKSRKRWLQPRLKGILCTGTQCIIQWLVSCPVTESSLSRRRWRRWQPAYRPAPGSAVSPVSHGPHGSYSASYSWRRSTAAVQSTTPGCRARMTAPASGRTRRCGCGSTPDWNNTHTHTHPFNGPLSGTTRVSRCQKGKTNLDFTEARDSDWQWHQLGRMQVCTSLQTDNHASIPPLIFLQAGCPSCRPTNSVKALKQTIN